MISFLSGCRLRASRFSEAFLKPRSDNEETARREHILNILLLSAIALVFAAVILHVMVTVFALSDPVSYANSTMPLRGLDAALFTLFAAYALSRKGFVRAAAGLFLALFATLGFWMAAVWSVVLPTSLLFLALAVVMAGILFGSGAAFFATAVSTAALFLINFLQGNGTLSPANTYWMSEVPDASDIVMIGAMFGIVATVSWLSNREIAKSLDRARVSEAELKAERDSLEEKVEERTRALREAEQERMAQMYRFAEFGRLSAGLFHDLANPLNAAMLNMEKVKDGGQLGEKFADTKRYLDRALAATHKMSDFIQAARRQMTNRARIEEFSPALAVREACDMLAHKARRAAVSLSSDVDDGARIRGDATKFDQIMLNLISNAIDAYDIGDEFADDRGARPVDIVLRESRGAVTVTVCDLGSGIAPGDAEKIFDPFFTTKGSGNMGIGLSIVKRIVEQDFHGAISAQSADGDGTVFTVSIPSDADATQQ